MHAPRRSSRTALSSWPGKSYPQHATSGKTSVMRPGGAARSGACRAPPAVGLRGRGACAVDVVAEGGRDRVHVAGLDDLEKRGVVARDLHRVLELPEVNCEKQPELGLPAVPQVKQQLVVSRLVEELVQGKVGVDAPGHVACRRSGLHLGYHCLELGAAGPPQPCE